MEISRMNERIVIVRSESKCDRPYVIVILISLLELH